MAEPTGPRITGAELVEIISAHPDWLELPVHMLNMADEAVWLTEIERDCFDASEGPVLSLLAHAPAVPGSEPRASYSALAERAELLEALLDETRELLAAATARAETAEVEAKRLQERLVTSANEWEAAVLGVHGARDHWQARALAEFERAEQAEAERDQLRAQLAEIGKTRHQWGVRLRNGDPDEDIETMSSETQARELAVAWRGEIPDTNPTAMVRTQCEPGSWRVADEQGNAEAGAEAGGAS